MRVSFQLMAPAGGDVAGAEGLFSSQFDGVAGSQPPASASKGTSRAPAASVAPSIVTNGGTSKVRSVTYSVRVASSAPQRVRTLSTIVAATRPSAIIGCVCKSIALTFPVCAPAVSPVMANVADVVKGQATDTPPQAGAAARESGALSAPAPEAICEARLWVRAARACARPDST